jgi:deazaflavin-dependent oxidoreductase (nitroreductase family)
MSNDDSERRAAEMLDFIKQHRRDYHSSGGAKGHIVNTGVVGTPRFSPTLVLKTIGRKTGKPHAAPLTYGLFGREWVVIASKGGAPEHPAWYLNLQPAPVCDIQIATQSFRCRWRVAQGEERQRVWDYMCALYPPYLDYERTTGGRVIPVIMLLPIEEVTAAE